MAIGIVAVWIGLLSIVTAFGAYCVAMVRSLRAEARAEGEPGAPAGGGGKPVKRAKGTPNHRRGRATGEDASGEEVVPGRIRKPLLLARRAFYLSCACVATAAITLETLILNQRYEVFYVWKNTNAALPFFFRFASFWADQEGTFILWAIYGSIIGLIFLRKASPEERWVMPFFCFIQAYLFVLMATMSAFKLHPLEGDVLAGMQMKGIPVPSTGWDRFAHLLGMAPVLPIPYGRGLNESLQNMWMVIHPPTLFVGYSTMVIPGCFALAALVRRDYNSWVNRAAPWLLFSWMVLGTGIFLGAYWAYETLGWGGYWAWDPVENSSLMPWLVGTALIHGLLSQRARGNFKHVNLLLGIMTFLAVLYGSFLTRSGVLENLSVHSFASPGATIRISLMIVMSLWGLGGLGLWIWRFRDIRSETAYDSLWERHFGIFLGLIVQSAIAVIVWGCVSAPVLVPLLVGTKPTVTHVYYNRAILPVAFVMMLLMAITPLAPWRQVRERIQMRPFEKVALAAAALLVVAFLPLGIYAASSAEKSHYGPALAVFGGAAGLSLLTNLVMLRRSFRSGILNMGPWISHIAFSLILIGVIVTAYFSQQQAVAVERGRESQAFGWTLIYQGMREPARKSHERSAMKIDVIRDGKTTRVEAPVFFSKVGEGGVMIWPRILHKWWGDVYISPNGQDRGEPVSLGEVREGKSSVATVVPRPEGGLDTVRVQFHGFAIDPEARRAMREGDPLPEFDIGANVSVNVDGRTFDNLQPAFVVARERKTREPLPVTVQAPDGRELTVELGGVREDGGNLVPNFNVYARDTGVFTVMMIPGINILWFGACLLIVGAFLSYRRRAVLAQRLPPRGD